MNRRGFITWLGASLLIPRDLGATPVASPASSEPPQSIDLGSGITMIDYRLHPGEKPNMIGEIRNETERMIDAPVVSLTYQRTDNSTGFTWASPILPVIKAGGTTPVFGPLPDDMPPEHILTTATFALCTAAAPGKYSSLQRALNDDVVITVTSERVEDAVYNAKGSIVNTGAEVVRNVSMRGIVRDNEGRIAGTTHKPYWSSLVPKTPKDFSLWAGGQNKANPFLLIHDANYTVEIIVGTQGFVASPGCTFGAPWDS